MKFVTEIYKDIEIEYHISEEGTFDARALGVLSSYGPNPSIFSGWEKLADAKRDIREQIDEFLSTTPTSYSELAKAIESTLVWTGYEDCTVDEFIIKTLVEGFIRYKQQVN
jgi:hypothetical protein